jgi:hypothetical protein
MSMSLFNTAIHYDVYLDIPDDIDFSWNYIYDNTVFDLDNFIQNLNIKNDQSLIVLWGVDRRINVNDRRFNKLNEWYHSIKNPMILFNGAVYPDSPGFLEFPYQQVEFFQYLSKLSFDRQSKLFHYLRKISNTPTPSKLEKSKKFFFASTKDYLSRRYILQSLINNGFKEQGYLAYKCIERCHTNESYSPIDLQLIQNAATSIDHLLPIQGFDTSIEYRDISPDIFSDAYLSIITETFFEGPVYFSEKTFNSMLYNHIFVYLGPPHSLAYLRSLGFKTWAHIIDESYDGIENSAERLFALTHSLNTFLSKPLEEIQQLYIENIELINHNRNLVLSTEINDTIVSAMRSAITFKN